MVQLPVNYDLIHVLLEQTHYICYNVAYIDLNGVFANKHESHYSPKKVRLLDSQTSR